MKSRKYTTLLVTLGVFLSEVPSQAATLYWDTNGSVDGAGTSPIGTWGTDSYWNTDSAGGAGTFSSSVGATNDAYFSAGTDAAGVYTVQISGTQYANSVTLGDGTPTLSGGVIALTGTTSSSGTTGSIIAGNNLTGTATVNSDILIDTGASGRLLKLTAANGAADTDLVITGAITTTNASTGYLLRLGGSGDGRIESALVTPGTAFLAGPIASNASSLWSGTWTIAGEQALGVGITLTNENKLVMGDSTADVQSWTTVSITGTSAFLTVNSTATASGATTLANGGTLLVGGDYSTTGITITGTGNRIVGASESVGALTLTSNSDATLTTGVTLGGEGTNENNLQLVKAGLGGLTVSNGVNTYTGGTTIVTGNSSYSIQLGASNALGMGDLVVGTADTGGNGARLRMAGYDQTVSSLSSGSVGTRVIENGVSGLSTLTIDQATDTTYSGILRNSASAGYGTLAVTKKGTGTLTLSGSNTFTGDLRIEGGTIAFGANNVLISTSAIILAGGTLASGTFNDTTLGTLTLEAGANYLTIGEGGAFGFLDSSEIDWDSNTLSITGAFVDGVSVRFGTSSSGLTATQLSLITINGLSATINSDGYLSAVAVPEPSSVVALMGIGVGAFATMRRRRV